MPKRDIIPVATESPLLTAAAAAAYLHLHVGTLANYRGCGRGPRYVRVGRQPLYRPADLDTWLDAHVFEHTADERIARHASDRTVNTTAPAGQSGRLSECDGVNGEQRDSTMP
jgi:hypothetical protein